MPQTPEKLNPRHYRIVDLTLLGVSAVDIASEVGINVASVGVIQRAPTFQHELALRRHRVTETVDLQLTNSHEQVENCLKNAALAAANKLVGSLDSLDEDIQIKSATELLDRTGHQKVNKIESKSVVLVLTPDDLTRIEQSLLLDREETKNEEPLSKVG